MSNFALLLVSIYTAILVGLIWARYRFFVVKSKPSRISSLLYDPVVVVQVISTYYHFTLPSAISNNHGYFSLCLYLLGFLLFWWSIITSKKLNFAFSQEVRELVTTGPFAWVRHPFYISYIATWLSSTLLFNSPLLWIPLAYLISFYVFSAKREERAILSSRYSKEYLKYSQNVGMFLPRINYGKVDIQDNNKRP